ncbi:unnamed protein product [Soboliphyme baturini]|uniref:Cytochrome c oxidase subunit 5A, mitochondrial n=1 Tax=Soboliphyme baturini TaxID=241478 RepID=A0A183IDN9_9BILA|nr:unnamed protein product [Soboliphyme baturini]
MLRIACSILKPFSRRLTPTLSTVTVMRQSSAVVKETPEEFDQRYVDFFNQPDIDGWLVRKGIGACWLLTSVPTFVLLFTGFYESWYWLYNLAKGLYELHKEDVIPEPKIVAAALRACRRVNDYALAVRFLEAVRLKCGRKANKIYPYVIQEVRPVLDELGISTPEEMGYDKPELFWPSSSWWPEEYYEIYNIPKYSYCPYYK